MIDLRVVFGLLMIGYAVGTVLGLMVGLSRN